MGDLVEYLADSSATVCRIRSVRRKFSKQHPKAKKRDPTMLKAMPTPISGGNPILCELLAVTPPTAKHTIPPMMLKIKMSARIIGALVKAMLRLIRLIES